MKRNILYTFILALLGVSSFTLFSCDSKEFEMSSKPEASSLNFEVVQDFDIDEGGNTVILKNSTSEIIPVWSYGTGRSTKSIDTVHYAFAGDYTIQFSALTAGGRVDAEPEVITVTEDNLNYVNDPLWTSLSGGVGETKAWVLDNGEYGMASGALSFAEPGEHPFEWNDFSPNWEPEGNAPGSTDEDMNWGNYMTFSLDGGPYMQVYDAEGNLIEDGTYFLDKDAHTITTSEVTILRAENYISNATNWNNNIKILTLDENQLRIGIYRDNTDEAEWWYIWNFVSKEYADNYVGEVEPQKPDEGFDPDFESGELLTMLTGGIGSGRIWTLDAEGNPIDWIASGNGWTTDASSSYDWGWNESWSSIASNSWIRFDQWNDSLTYTRNQNGTETVGSFTIDEETNEIRLEGETLIQNPKNEFSPEENVIKVLKAFDDYAVKGIWFGTSYDEEKDEWLAFHYVIP